MTIINSKTVARIAAVQFAYQISLEEESSKPEEIISKLSSYYNDKEILNDLDENEIKIKFKLNSKFFVSLAQEMHSNLQKIDDLISLYLSEDWNFQTLHITLKAILRAGVCEILLFPESPTKVIINEYTNIAADMVKTQEIGFINSILDTIASKVRRDEA